MNKLSEAIAVILGGVGALVIALAVLPSAFIVIIVFIILMLFSALFDVIFESTISKKTDNE